MNGRLDRLRAVLEEPLLVSSAINVRYLTGFKSSNAVLLVEPDRVRLFTDFRYAERARAVAGVELVETRRNVFADLALQLEGRIAFEAGDLTYDRHEALSSAGVELVPRRGLVEALRVVKEETELAAIRRAAAIGDEAFRQLAEERFAGRTERELAWRMEALFHELEADGLSFPVTVAAGANAALPHTEPGDRTIEPGDAVLVDAGCTVDGYCSDCTRTFAVGSLSRELERAYEVCRRAQEIGLAAVAPAVPGIDVDRIARDVIDHEGLGQAFGHGLGHGIGLVVHEAPYLNPESSDVLAPGNAVTVEPGIYLSGLGGIRIEDLVIVGEDGPEVLTPFTKELVTVR